jgi:hypothetical protein
MAGSSLATSALELNLRVNWPVIGDEWADAKVISRLGCWAGSMMSEIPEIVNVGIAVEPIESWNCFVALPDALSETRTVKVESAAAEGAPPRIPLEAFSVSPAGSDPELTDQV